MGRRFHGYTLRSLLRVAVPVFLRQRSLGTQEGSDLRVRSNGKGDDRREGQFELLVPSLEVP